MSKLWDIVKTVGSTALQVALPGTGTAIVSAINEFLPSDEKLPSGATGDDAIDAISRMNPEAQAAVMTKQFDVDITRIRQQHATLQAMLTSDATQKHTTRPHIAKGCFYVVAFATVVTVSIWAYAVATKDEEMLSAINGGWVFALSVIGPLVTVLHAYFGVLRKESADKLNAANGNPIVRGMSALWNSKK